MQIYLQKLREMALIAARMRQKCTTKARRGSGEEWTVWWERKQHIMK